MSTPKKGKNPGRVGTPTETAIVKACIRGGFPNAERLRLRGKVDHGDIRLDNARTVMIESKGGATAEAATDGKIAEWMVETSNQRENGNWHVGILVTKRKGYGMDTAEKWWAWMWLSWFDELRGLHHTGPDVLLRMTLAEMLSILVDQGYGEENPVVKISHSADGTPQPMAA